MLDVFFKINWLGVLTASAGYILLSGIWHRPFAFGKLWYSAMGFERKKDWKETGIYYIIPTISCFLTSTGIAFIHSAAKVASFYDALITGLVVGALVGAAVTFTNAVIPIMRNPVRFGLITGTAHLLGITFTSLLYYIINAV